MPDHTGQDALAGLVENKADDECPHDRTSLLDRGRPYRGSVSSRLRWLRKMVSFVNEKMAAAARRCDGQRFGSPGRGLRIGNRAKGDFDMHVSGRPKTNCRTARLATAHRVLAKLEVGPGVAVRSGSRAIAGTASPEPHGDAQQVKSRINLFGKTGLLRG